MCSGSIKGKRRKGKRTTLLREYGLTATCRNATMAQKEEGNPNTEAKRQLLI